MNSILLHFLSSRKAGMLWGRNITFNPLINYHMTNRRAEGEVFFLARWKVPNNSRNVLSPPPLHVIMTRSRQRRNNTQLRHPTPPLQDGFVEKLIVAQLITKFSHFLRVQKPVSGP
jgi:hypothetical protein